MASAAIARSNGSPGVDKGNGIPENFRIDNGGSEPAQAGGGETFFLRGIADQYNEIGRQARRAN
jgi:hypothetical protein